MCFFRRKNLKNDFSQKPLPNTFFRGIGNEGLSKETGKVISAAFIFKGKNTEKTEFSITWNDGAESLSCLMNEKTKNDISKFVASKGYAKLNKQLISEYMKTRGLLASYDLVREPIITNPYHGEFYLNERICTPSLKKQMQEYLVSISIANFVSRESYESVIKSLIDQ